MTRISERKRPSRSAFIIKSITGFSESLHNELTPQEPTAPVSWRTCCLSVAVSIITFLVYLPALKNNFLEWDDPTYVTENVNIRSFNLALLRWSFLDFYASNWHPLTWISHAADYLVWGLNPLGHHLTNNIIHSVNTALVVLLIIRLLEMWKDQLQRQGLKYIGTVHDDLKIWISAGVTGLLFGLHPLHVESVAWIAERKDLLCAMFFLLSIMMYLRYVRAIADETVLRKSTLSFLTNKWYLVSVVFFVLSLLSKPMAVSLPAVLLILDWYPLQRVGPFKSFRTAYAEKIPFIILSLFSSFLTILAQKTGGSIASFEAIPLASRIIVAAQSLIAYWYKMILPIRLSAVYPYPEDMSLLSLKYFLPIISVGGITIASIFLAKRQKLIFSVWWYYLVTLLPVLGIIQVGSQSMADRYSYLPSIGPFFIFAILLVWIREKTPRHGPLLILLASVVLSLYTLSTIKRTSIWRDDLTLFSDTIRKSPNSEIAHGMLGLALSDKGAFDEAIEQFRTVLKLNPNSQLAYYDLGRALMQKGLVGEAITAFQNAVSLNPSNLDAHQLLALAYAKSGMMDEALREYSGFMRWELNSPLTFIKFGIQLQKEGLRDKAIEQYKRALALNANLVAAHYHLALVYHELGQLDQALEHLKVSVRLQPTEPQLHNLLGIAYTEKGLYEDAAEQFELAVKLAPEEPSYRNNLEKALAKKLQ
jgi:protein O-mannosyl-transferase